MYDHRLLNNLITNLSDSVVIIDDKGTVLKVNPLTVDLFGYDEQELLGCNVSILMPEPYRSNHDRYLKNYRLTGNRTILNGGRELVARKKNGSLFPIYLRVQQVELDGTRTYIGVIHDISGRKLAETAYRETSNKLQAILNTAVEGMIIINQKGRIEMANPSSLRLFGYAENELINKNVNVLMPEPDRSNHDQYIRNYQKTGQRKVIGIGREVIGRKKDGSTFPVLLSVSEVQLRNSVIYVGMLHDLTAEHEVQLRLKQVNARLEEKVKKRTSDLEKMNKELKGINSQLELEIEKRSVAEENALKALYKEKELNEMKGRFVSMASHEFRTPLSGILTSVSLLSRYTGPEFEDKRKRHIATIKSSVHNLTSILNDFLNLDKLDEGRIKYNPAFFEIKPFIDEVIAEIEPTCKPKQTIVARMGPEMGKVWGERHLLKNTVINLTSNAIKYSMENQPIELDFSMDKNELQLKVTDYGIGIPEKDQQYMFQRLFRASNVSNIQGTGLGLNIVKKYVDLHGGSITFVSRPGQGTTFTIRIPQDRS